nr:MAG TPA: hypothetical protein [Caudoviricetes sp.]DAV38927.1 MAG TPA: hypothetical protein [Caudoviricetes sp.]
MVIVSRINSAADSVFGSQRPVHGAALCLSPPISDKSIRFQKIKAGTHTSLRSTSNPANLTVRLLAECQQVAGCKIKKALPCIDLVVRIIGSKAVGVRIPHELHRHIKVELKSFVREFNFIRKRRMKDSKFFRIKDDDSHFVNLLRS